MDDLDDFLVSLAAQPQRDNLFNPYADPSRLANLEAYLRLLLQRPGRRVLLVGEALGYRGGSLTGIPFSSERLLLEAPHAFLRQLRPHLQLSGNTAEATASLHWQALEGRRIVPLCWNAVPFHPHQPNEPTTNRAPTAGERREGESWLRRLAELYQPDQVAGVGGHGHRVAVATQPQYRPVLIRHPSYGGKQAFERGLQQLLHRRYRKRPRGC